MRVIAGSAKGRRLKGPTDRAGRTRPTSDLVRGAVFSALASMETDMTRVLDVYAGSGALGIEALSRGAESCDFVERDAGACAVIKENLLVTGFASLANVFCMPVARAIQRLEGPYTLVLADPPYDDAEAPVLMELLASSALVEALARAMVSKVCRTRFKRSRSSWAASRARTSISFEPPPAGISPAPTSTRPM